ncbi:uncharacterized protein M421DRAFT_420501 [Didymella exigua CBS 183.55]|uniref:Rhodopsin domain-containing protein n=1 Tax=Didymella exigua CBS 183.55 TaxID=1150837 RepID=A0A6A5RTB9_9PLEO|nr:uncharacterized protein M421DRAFT_420501 [Didymella exigua CBS 183.55]KAF1928617.1 hypothetical protein M421DRAFT_420501 [Didymella exigua CBS 183.55]
MSAQSSWDALLAEAIQKAPDPHEPLPYLNRPATIYGWTISFLVVTWFAFSFRLWVRIRVVREPGWDDVLVAVAAILNTVASISVCISIHYGLGQHMLYLGEKKLGAYFISFYIEHSIYLTETAIIKVSLLLQYLRIFKAGRMRWLCLALLVVISLWGLAFSILGWFPCAPVRAYWNRTGNFVCYGYGFRDRESFAALFQAHSASNLFFDIAVFATPLVLFRTPNLKFKNLLALGGVFAVGTFVILISVWRLKSIVQHRAALVPYPDFTWWTPVSIILACLEIDLAIICASIPIFWPVLQKSFSAIFVSHEIEVVETRIKDHGLAYELEHTQTRGHHSMTSGSGTSTHELTHDPEDGYKEPYSVGVDPLGEEAQSGQGLQTNINSEPKRKWDM